MSIPSSDGRWKKGLLPTLRELGITTALLSLARMLHQGEDIIPIPGTSRRDRIAENAIAAKIIFDPEALEKISELAAPGSAVGKTLQCSRYQMSIKARLWHSNPPAPKEGVLTT